MWHWLIFIISSVIFKAGVQDTGSILRQKNFKVNKVIYLSVIFISTVRY